LLHVDYYILIAYTKKIYKNLELHAQNFVFIEIQKLYWHKLIYNKWQWPKLTTIVL